MLGYIIYILVCKMKARVVYIRREKADVINAIPDAEKDFIEEQQWNTRKGLLSMESDC